MKKIYRERQRRRQLLRNMITLALMRKRFITRLCLLTCLLLQSCDDKICHVSATSQVSLVWASYDEQRSKTTFRVSRPSTFKFILRNIRPDIEKDFITKEPVSADCRLAICLYRLGRGDYLYTIAELFGLGVTTVHKIIEEVCEAIASNLWKLSAQSTFSNTLGARGISLFQGWSLWHSG